MRSTTRSILMATAVDRCMKRLAVSKRRSPADRAAETRLARRLTETVVRPTVVPTAAGNISVAQTRQAVQAAVADSRDEIVEALIREQVNVGRRGATAAGANLSDEQLAAAARARAEAAADRIVANVTDDLVADVEALRGISADEADRVLRERADHVVAREARSSARIAVTNASSQATAEAIETLGIPYQKWVTVGDARVRSTHAAQNGQIAARGTPFSNGLAYPGDTNGPASEWANCRCHLEPWTPPDGTIVPPGKTTFFESETIPAA